MTQLPAAALPRWWRYINVRQLKCPGGHPIPRTSQINETGFIRCPHWIADERRECGRWVFLFSVRGGGAIVAEVALDEQRTIEELSTPAAMLEYLGIFFDGDSIRSTGSSSPTGTGPRSSGTPIRRSG